MKFTQSLKTTAAAVRPCNSSDYTAQDGYDWINRQYDFGYNTNPAYGDWPYLAIVTGVSRNTGHYVVKEYCEHDVRVWIYANDKDGKEEYRHHLNHLKEAYKDN